MGVHDGYNKSYDVLHTTHSYMFSVTNAGMSLHRVIIFEKVLLTTETKSEVTVLCWPLKARNFAASKRFKRTGLTLEAKDQRIPQLHDPIGPTVPTIAKTAESNDLGHDPNDELL